MGPEKWAEYPTPFPVRKLNDVQRIKNNIENACKGKGTCIIHKQGLTRDSTDKHLLYFMLLYIITISLSALVA